ncbi:MAG: Fic family protein [Melioribacteraceae bacterium]
MSKEKSVLLELLTKVDDLKKEIDAFHPLPADVEERIMQKFRLDWNYNSNAIEGNALNYGETVAFLMHGITAHGKPLKDYLDIKGHNQAINYLLNFVRNKVELTEAVIRELHKTILVEPYEIDAITADGKATKRTVAIGAYKTQPNHVKTATGEMHYFATPEETPAKMQDLMTWYRKAREDKEVHPVVLASFFHHRFVSIHPFDDGNGRMARLLMNLLLMQSNYPPVVIRTKDKNNYYLALSQADAGNTSPFVEYVANALTHSEEIYLKGAKGESIEELDDVDKEIVLFKKEILGREDAFEQKRTEEDVKDIFDKFFSPLLVGLSKGLSEIKSLFFKSLEHWRHPNSNQNVMLSIFSILLEEQNYYDKITAAFGKDYLSYTFHFIEFKTAKNPFTIFLSVAIIFQEYSYYFGYKIGQKLTYPEVPVANSPKSQHDLIQKYYHQSFSKDEMQQLIVKIKKELFDKIKEKANE